MAYDSGLCWPIDSNTIWHYVREFQNMYSVHIHSVRCTTHRTAVRNLEHDDLTHSKPSSIFALFNGNALFCLFFNLFFLGEHLHATAIKPLPQWFQIIVVIMMEKSEASEFSLLFFFRSYSS